MTPELTFQGQTTTGPSETFTVTVNPSAQVNQVEDITVNSGEAVNEIIFSTSNTSGTTTYYWTIDNTSLGLPSSGSGNIQSFTAINASTTPIVGTITVIPTFTNGGISCEGAYNMTFAITVNPAAGSITDQNGNTYDYLTYGNQAWTVDNAEMVTYRDGTPIPQVTADTEWRNLTTGAWCYYNNDETKPRLYNWYAVMGIYDEASLLDASLRKEFAPEGWHVPSDTEWTTLEEHLITNGYNYDDTTEGNKIAKSMASTTGWNISTNTGAIGNDQSLNNSSDFNAFPGGDRRYNSDFVNAGYGAFFWSSTESISDTGYLRYLNGSNSYLYRNPSNFLNKKNGFSVRFVRD